MFPASVRGPGQNVCAPDVCLTPPVPVPVPYVNVGLHAVAVMHSVTVMFGGMFALNLGSTLAVTMGDEPGVVGGVISGTIKGTGYFITGSPIVMIDGLPAVRVTSVATGNMHNAWGSVVTPGVPTVLIAYDGLDRAEEAPDANEPAAVRRILAELERDCPADVAMLSDAIGYVRLERFSVDAPRVFFNAHARLTREGADSFVLDLRGCAGGDLEAAYALAADFLPEGALLGRIVDADGDASERVAPCEGRYRAPLALLVDGGTKSAAEAFAGALAHHGRATVIGSPTFGKATAQALDVGLGGYASLATSAHLELPDGSSFAGIGLRPDVLV
jgi:carboxyl-terminal processing protease